MSGMRGWLLFAALLSLSVTAVVNSQEDVEDSDDFMDIVEKAFLLVRHQIDTVELVQGKNTSVVVEIYNAGNRYQLQHLRQLVVAACCNSSHTAKLSTSLFVQHSDQCNYLYSAATDIILKGAEWPLSDFEDSGGVTSGSWSKLSPGATVRVEYFLTPKASGPYAPLAATVTYKAEADAKTQVRPYVAAITFEMQIATKSILSQTALVAGCLWCDTKSVHPLPNTEADENSPLCGEMHVFARLLGH